MKTNIVLWLLFGCVINVFGQSEVLTSRGKEIITSGGKTTSLYLGGESLRKKSSRAPSHQLSSTKNLRFLSDTLTYFSDYSPNSSFGIFGQDWVVQWFVAPADMIISNVGLSVVDVADTNVQLEVKLVNLNWKKYDLQTIVERRLGYYPANGNGNNNITAFLDNPDRTGDWIDSSGLGLASPFGKDLWSDSGKGVIIQPILKSHGHRYQWIKLDTLNSTAPVVPSGAIVGIAVRNLSPMADSLRVGIAADHIDGYDGLKFYTNGRFQPGVDFGWWSRLYTFDFVLEVKLSDGCFTLPRITELSTTLSTEQREVSAEIIHCEPDDIAKSKVSLVYSFDTGTTYTSVPMTTKDSADFFQTFKGMIPGAQPGTQVMYKVIYTNAGGNFTESQTVSYNIFKPENPSLIVFNGFTKISGYPQSLYFGSNGATTTAQELINFPKDSWAYGPLTKEMVDNYNNIFEITTSGPKDINNDVIKEWLAASPNHNYLLAGDEYLGFISGWKNSTYNAGDFQYDILGISADYNDINYKTEGDNNKASYATSVVGTELGDSLYLKVLALQENSLMIGPTNELGSTYYNWLDGFDPVAGTFVDITAQGVDGKTYNVCAHRTLPSGNKIAFLAFDPLSLVGGAPNHFWYGFDRVSPLVQAMRWFGADVVDVEDWSHPRATFLLAQNYPNPFNPATTISFQVSLKSKVSLKVYDILGNEIAGLVNEEKPAGSYTIKFDGSNLASGVYFYTLRAGSFVQSRKMILLK